MGFSVSGVVVMDSEDGAHLSQSGMCSSSAVVDGVTVVSSWVGGAIVSDTVVLFFVASRGSSLSIHTVVLADSAHLSQSGISS